MITKIIISLNATLTAAGCAQLQTTIVDALTANNTDLFVDRVATFANSSVNVAGDWLPILMDNAPLAIQNPLTNACCQLVTSMSIELLTAATGSALNAQMKIVGVRRKFGNGRPHKPENVSVYTRNLRANCPRIAASTS